MRPGDAMLTIRRWPNFQVALACILVVACNPRDLSGSEAAITEIHVDGPASGPSECRDFRLDETEIRFFWTNAAVITPQEWQQAYDVLPCDLNGSFVRDGQVYSWRINAGGSGRLAVPDGNAELYGCRDCRGRY